MLAQTAQGTNRMALETPLTQLNVTGSLDDKPRKQWSQLAWITVEKDTISFDTFID